MLLPQITIIILKIKRTVLKKDLTLLPSITLVSTTETPCTLKPGDVKFNIRRDIKGPIEGIPFVSFTTNTTHFLVEELFYWWKNIWVRLVAFLS